MSVFIDSPDAHFSRAARCDRMTRGKPRYNIANATDSLPQVSVTNFDKNDERVTCASCRFRYSSVREFCPMCGEQASADNAALEASRQAIDRRLDLDRGPLAALRELSQRRLAKTIVLVSIVVLVCAGSYLALRSRLITNSPAAVPSVDAPTTRPDTSKAVAPSTKTEMPPIEDGKIRSAEPQPAADISTETNDDDPAQLWNRVRHGDSEAEVSLAKLYLSGTAVERNCEQAHMLLLAASRKQNKAADKVLDGAYKQTCP